MHGTTTYLTGECCKHEFYQKYPPLMMHGAATDLTGECCKHGLHCTHPVAPVVTVILLVNISGWAPLRGPPVGLCVYMAHISLNTYMAAIVRPVLLPKLFGDCGVQLCWWMPMIWAPLMNNNACFVKLGGLMQCCIVIADLVWIMIVVLCLTCNLSFSCSITNLASWLSSNKISHILP